jgi:hypothetical protein
MTPKEKAEELVQRFSKIESFYIHERIVFMPLSEAKQCALIAVDEILKICVDSLGLTELDYWQDVKEEIESL